MMKTVPIPWSAWHQDVDFNLIFPSEWNLEVCNINYREGLDEHQIQDAIGNPIGINRISSIAKEKTSAVIGIEDITRPSYIGDIISVLIHELNSGGITHENIKFVVCNGSHRTMQRDDLIKKLGRNIVEKFLVINHNPYDGLMDTGITMDSIPVKINKFFLEADFRILVGSILPHAFAGFSGGAKLVIPGLAGIEILERSHKYVLMGFRGGTGDVEKNRFRMEIERLVKKIRVDFSVGYVPNANRQISGVFAGEIISAHREGVDFARSMYKTNVPDNIDVMVLNAYPKDTEFLQVDNVFPILKSSLNKIKGSGTIVITSACSEGFGSHSLFGPGMRLYKSPLQKRFLSGRSLMFFSPNINNSEFRTIFWEGYSLFYKWEDVISVLNQKYPSQCNVAIFPTAPLSLL